MPETIRVAGRRACSVVAVFIGLVSCGTVAAEPTLPGVGPAIQARVDAGEIAGAVTLVADSDGILHEECTGFADVASGRPMKPDTVFFIASMSKPVTGAAVMMLVDEGRLGLDEPVEKYLPEFAGLKTPSGKPARLTVAHMLTHTSGLGEAGGEAAKAARTLADLVPAWLAAPMKYEPGSKWAYTQSGINAAARIVEVVSGKPFDTFLEERLFGPLGMVDTTFYPSEQQRQRLAVAYARDEATSTLRPVPLREGLGDRSRPPLGSSGLFSTGRDYARFSRMLLGGGTLSGTSVLSDEAVRTLATIRTGDLPTGFFQGEAQGRHGHAYGWGMGTCVLRAPHEGVVAMLSPGTFGHGGAWGTQAWIDPVRKVAFILMVQRSNFPNSDASEVRRVFQEAAAAAVDARTAR